MQILIVVGNTGEGPDHCSWNAKAFRDRIHAEAHVEEIKEEVKRLEELAKIEPEVDDWMVVEGGMIKFRFFGVLDFEERGPFETKLLSLDPNFRCDYTGVWYRIEELELADPI